MITRKVAPALAAGCAVVLKPAEQTPLSALALAELAERAGVPAGVLNVVTTNDPAAAGAEFTSNPLVREIACAGSTEVGRILMRQSADQVKKISFELGGNAPLIVFDDADLEAAVEGAIASKYRNAGVQTCVCANRIYVQDAIYDALREEVRRSRRSLQGRSRHRTRGGDRPAHRRAGARRKVEEHVADALRQGRARARRRSAPRARGSFLRAHGACRSDPRNAPCARRRTFGPVAPLFRFRTEEEAVRMANAAEFGLAAYFFARRRRAPSFASPRRSKPGSFSVNTGIFSQEVAPFGGVKQSGIGREGSKYGIEPFLEIKFVCLGGIQP
ncbi:MAG: aldehyde dehydrogenase family protein [Burkholderiales bacterium]|nr:aldehyde dehydrogenase family protein [Burkholderiales bacterium]